MTKFSIGLLLGISAGVAGWWMYNQSGSQHVPVERGEIIFSNSPVAG
jgi:hypothetical protein